MSVTKKKIEKLFPHNDFDNLEPQLNLLSTIRVPKNLLYLTDTLPKPNYSSDTHKMSEAEELLRRRTYEGSQMLPDINNSYQNDETLRKNSDKRSKYNDKISANGSVGASGHPLATDGSV